MATAFMCIFGCRNKAQSLVVGW